MSSTTSPPPLAASNSDFHAQRQEKIVSRVVGGALIAAVLVYAATLGPQPATEIILVSFPLLLGSALSLIASGRLTQKTESWQAYFQERLEAARAGQGKYQRWFKRPLYGGFTMLWRWTRPIGYGHLRASVRIAGLLYFGAIMLYLLLIAVYVIVALFVLGLVLVAVAKVAGWSDKREAPRGSELSPLPFLGGRGTSIRREGLTDPYIKHRDERGRKVGVSREREGIMERYVEHLDGHGERVGESREREGLVGPYTEHTDCAGKKVGGSREREGLRGEYVERTDAGGDKIGESREREGLTGPYIEHTDK